MFEDLDDPQAPTPPPELRDTVVRIAAHRRMRRRLVVAAVAAAVVAVPAALVATGTSPIRRFTVSSASEHRPTTTTVAGQPPTKPRVVGARRSTTSTTWNGVLHCDARPLAQRQATDSTLVSAQRFGRWIVTTRSAGDHQTLAVQDCSTNKLRVVPAPPPGRACATYDSLDMGADVLLYRCRYADDSQVVIANDLTKNTVTPVTESPDRSWRSGSMAPGGGYVVFTGAEPSPATSTSTTTDVFVFDLATRTLDRLPRAYGGLTDRDSESRGISIDGRSVLVSSAGPPTRPGATSELYLFDRLTRAFAPVPGPDKMIGTAALSGDGRHVGFEAVPTTDQGPAAYAYDAGAVSASFVSLCGEAGSVTDCGVRISEDGSTVTFTAAPCISVTGTSDRTGGTYTFDRGKGTVHKDADALDTRDCTPSNG